MFMSIAGDPTKLHIFFNVLLGVDLATDKDPVLMLPIVFDLAGCLPTRQRYGLAYILVVTSGGPHAVSTLRQAGSARMDESHEASRGDERIDVQ